MLDLNNYLHDLISECRTAFGDRLLYVGLQGSYLRGEAHEESDIDVMVILDRFDLVDMDTYRGILKKIGFYEKSCGFICGKEEMKRWNPLEVCQLRHTTKDLFGVLTDFLPFATREDEINYVKISLGNLYHEICHRYIHADRDKNVRKFRDTCKSVFFLIQNLHYLESGRFVLAKRELKEAVSPEDRRVLELAELPEGFDFDQAFAALFAWCQAAFTRIDENTGDGSMCT
ncbi:MAG: nucleotidyltransferase domain-containing protein [Clostridia bacterium]|nr:nucleotidyltransferase domain-containing protein [Clostridia bacterium]